LSPLSADTSQVTAPVIGEDSTQRQRAFAEWRPVDELILTAMAHTRASIEDMARRLGRTRSEIEIHLGRLGLR